MTTSYYTVHAGICICTYVFVFGWGHADMRCVCNEQLCAGCETAGSFVRTTMLTTQVSFMQAVTWKYDYEQALSQVSFLKAMVFLGCTEVVVISLPMVEMFPRFVFTIHEPLSVHALPDKKLLGIFLSCSIKHNVW